MPYQVSRYCLQPEMRGNAVITRFACAPKIILPCAPIADGQTLNTYADWHMDTKVPESLSRANDRNDHEQDLAQAQSFPMAQAGATDAFRRG
jgi:hypothetical protein